MRPDRMILSAYIDGEIPERFASEIEAAIEGDSAVRADYDELRGLSQRLVADPPVGVGESSRRSWEAIARKIQQRPVQRDVWHRRIPIPMPLVAAAATLIVALLGVLGWMIAPSRAAEEPLTRANDVDVTIRVDGSNMEQVLKWLVDQNKLGEVNIQLPEQRFQIMGESVLVKPAQYSGGSAR